MDAMEDRSLTLGNRRILDRLRQVPKMVNRGQKFIGVIKGAENYLVKGQVEGRSDLRGVLMLSEGALWQGDITADIVVIRGTVVGNILARHKIEISGSARISGKVESPLIAVAKGALIKGGTEEGSLITNFEERRLP
jgi:cytoskeletal protein CcmA (bactofilin family)